MTGRLQFSDVELLDYQVRKEDIVSIYVHTVKPVMIKQALLVKEGNFSI